MPCSPSPQLGFLSPLPPCKRTRSSRDRVVSVSSALTVADLSTLSSPTQNSRTAAGDHVAGARGISAKKRPKFSGVQQASVWRANATGAQMKSILLRRDVPKKGVSCFVHCVHCEHLKKTLRNMFHSAPVCRCSESTGTQWFPLCFSSPKSSMKSVYMSAQPCSSVCGCCSCVRCPSGREVHEHQH